jgi:hypothetical protein
MSLEKKLQIAIEAEKAEKKYFQLNQVHRPSRNIVIFLFLWLSCASAINGK